MLKASQKRTKRAPLSEAVDVEHARPAPRADWPRCPPAGRPGARSRPAMLSRVVALHLEERRRRPRRAGSRRACRTACWRCRGRRRAAPRRAGRPDRRSARCGGGLEVVRRAGSRTARGSALRHSSSESWTKWATPDTPPWVSAPPSSSKLDLFVRDRLHHVRSGHEHVAHAAHHEDEVGDGRASTPRRRRRDRGSREICGTTPEASVLRRKMSA